MRRAIDTTLFPDDHVFFGGDLYLTANNIDMDNQTWKWQIDYYGLAACLLSLIAKPFNGRPMFTRENSLYTWSAKPFKFVLLCAMALYPLLLLFFSEHIRPQCGKTS